jgi:hypothetical protein
MSDLDLHRVVYITATPQSATHRTVVRYELGIDPEDAIDTVLRGLRLPTDMIIESVWAVPDDGIVTYACKSIGDFRRGDPIPRQRDRTL